MATPTETFVLVEMHTTTEIKAVKTVIRTYLSAPRADEDLELMQEAAPHNRFEVLTVTHIDN